MCERESERERKRERHRERKREREKERERKRESESERERERERERVERERESFLLRQLLRAHHLFVRARVFVCVRERESQREWSELRNGGEPLKWLRDTDPVAPPP